MSLGPQRRSADRKQRLSAHAIDHEMSTTTQILFNSPALHSLKRDQLVKLCKIHSLKANGKNVELIDRLKQHASTLPKDSPLSIAARSEDDNDACNDQDDRASLNSYINRPSQQWEVVMESITEDEEGSSKGTLNSIRTVGNSGSAGEFGTGNSKGTTKGSSIKALASSLGLKRIAAKSSVPPPPDVDELTKFSTPYSSLPPAASLPQTDHFTFTPSRLSSGSIGEVIPGHTLRPGVPAPENARLSLGSGAPTTPHKKQPTTTIRLISNSTSNDRDDISYGAGEHGTPQLKPFETTFDLILGSPSSNAGTLTRWPPGDADEPHSGLYPKLPLHDLAVMSPSVPNSSLLHTLEAKDEDGDIVMNEDRASAALSPSTDEKQLKPPSEPFIFGSPHPRYSVSNDQFRSAASNVLEEMNKRLQEQGVDGVGTELLNRLKPGAHAGIDLSINTNSSPAIKQSSNIGNLFDKAHEEEFKKMEGIDEFVKRRAQKEGQSLQLSKKRKSSILGTGAGRDAHGRRIPGAHVGRVSATRVISGGRRARHIPGSFDIDSDDEEELPHDTNKVNMNNVEAEADDDKKEKERREEEERQKERQREAIKRKLEINRARRRSSAAPGGLNGRTSGRVSVGRGGLLVKPQPKPSRFGFLASAKSIVKNVWNRGKTNTPAAQPSNLPKVAVVGSSINKKEKERPPTLTKKPESSVLQSLTQISAVRTQKVRVQDAGNGSTSGHSSKSLLPSIGSTSTRTSVVPSGTARSNRNSSSIGHSRNGSTSSKLGTQGGSGVSSRTSTAGASSLGARPVAARTSGAVGSMGIKKVPVGRIDSTSSKRMSSISSRLMAPTASSLAKMQRPSIINMKDSADNHTAKITTPQPTQLEALGSITNNSVKSTKPFPPTPGKIFRAPLDFRSGIPTPVKKNTASPSASEMSPPNSPTSQPSATTGGIVRQKTLSGRKPRISRSKVIAKLASQRAAATSSGSAILTPRVASGSGKMRSSLGAKAQRASFAGGGVSSAKRRSGGSDVLMSAKKRARQSEYARRRSRAGKAEADE